MQVFLDIYLMWTLSGSAHSNNLKLMKTPKPIKFGFFKKNRVNHKKTQSSIKCTGLGFKNSFFNHGLYQHESVNLCWIGGLQCAAFSVVDISSPGHCTWDDQLLEAPMKNTNQWTIG